MPRIIRNIVIFLLAFTYCNAQELTTGNLITNGDFETGNSNGWTTGGDGRVLEDCCVLNNRTSNYDYEFGDSGYISQEFGLTSNSITTEMLDNGITLNSTIEVQNGECGVQGCWGGTGAADTFTNQLKIKDVTGKTLAEVTQNRTDTTGINGQDFQDTLIYTGTGSYYGNIRISGTDANAPANLGGPNVDNVVVTMTYDSAVMPTAIQTELNTVFEELFFELEEEFKEEKFTFKEEKIEFKEELKFEESIVEFFEEPMIMQEMKEEEKFEEIIMTMAPEIEEKSKEEEPMEMVMEFFNEENSEEESLDNSAEEGIISIVENKSNKEEKNERSEELNEEESNSETTQTTDAKETNNNKQKNIQSKKTIQVTHRTVLDKIDEKIKDVGKNLELKNLITLKAMSDSEILLEAYNVPFYKPRDIYQDQLSIVDNRDIYSNINLNRYVQNDPISTKVNKINEIKNERQQLLIQLEVLKNEL